MTYTSANSEIKIRNENTLHPPLKGDKTHYFLHFSVFGCLYIIKVTYFVWNSEFPYLLRTNWCLIRLIRFFVHFSYLHSNYSLLPDIIVLLSFCAQDRMIRWSISRVVSKDCYLRRLKRSSANTVVIALMRSRSKQ